MPTTCPYCQETIKSDRSCFCFHCGKRLPEVSLEDSSVSDSSLVPTRPLLPRVLVTVVLTFGLSLVGISVYRWQRTTPSLSNPQVEGIQEVGEVVVPQALALPSGAFGQEALGELISGDADFYWESSRPEVLAGLVGGEKLGKQVTEVFGVSLEEGATFLSSAYALAGWWEEEGPVWLFISKLKGRDFVEQKLEDWPASFWEGWESEVLSDYFVLTNSPEKLTETADLLSQGGSNLEDAELSNYRSLLPLAGQALILAKGDEGRQVAKSLLSLMGGEDSGQAFAEALLRLDGAAFVLSSQKGQTLVQGAYQ